MSRKLRSLLPRRTQSGSEIPLGFTEAVDAAHGPEWMPAEKALIFDEIQQRLFRDDEELRDIVGQFTAQSDTTPPAVDPNANALICGDTKEEKRNNILKEFVTTEVTYVSGLLTASAVFEEPTRAAGERLLSQAQQCFVFANLKAVCDVHVRFLAALARAVSAIINKRGGGGALLRSTVEVRKSIGEVFLAAVDELEATYKDYVSHYSARQSLLKSEELKEFVQFREVREQHLLDFHTLSSFLITPIQRVPRYLLLLREYEKTLNERQFGSELEFARKAGSKLKEVATSLDGVTKNSSESLLLLETVSKLSAEHRDAIDLEDVVASGPIRLRAHEGLIGLVDLFCILTRDILYGCLVKKDKATIEWAVCLLHSTVATETGRASWPTISLRELVMVDHEPFLEERELELVPQLQPPFDVGFWSTSLSSVVRALWIDNTAMLAASAQFKRHMETHLMSPADWKLVQVGSVEMAFSKGEHVLKKGDETRNVYIILSGSVLVQVPKRGRRATTLSVLREGQFVGEYGFIRNCRIASASVVANEDNTRLACIDMDTLVNILCTHPPLMKKFFALQSCLLANRFMLSTFKAKRVNEMKRCATLSSWMNLPVPTEAEQKGSDRKSSLDSLNRRSSSSSNNAVQKNPKLKAVRAALGDKCKGQDALGQYAVDVLRKSKKPKKMTLFLFDTDVVLYAKTLYTSSVKCTALSKLRECNQQGSERLCLVQTDKSTTVTFENAEEAASAHAIISEKIAAPGSPASKRRPSGPVVPQDTMTAADDVFAFTSQELNELFELGEYIKLENGKVLLRRGQHSDSLYQVIQGKCRVFLGDYEEGDVPTPEQMAQKSLVIAEDGVIGELSFIQKGAASATVVAWSTLHSVILMEWNKRKLEDYFRTHERFAGKFYRLLALNITDRLLERQKELDGVRARNALASTIESK